MSSLKLLSFDLSSSLLNMQQCGLASYDVGMFNQSRCCRILKLINLACADPVSELKYFSTWVEQRRSYNLIRQKERIWLLRLTERYSEMCLIVHRGESATCAIGHYNLFNIDVVCTYYQVTHMSFIIFLYFQVCLFKTLWPVKILIYSKKNTNSNKKIIRLLQTTLGVKPDL